MTLDDPSAGTLAFRDVRIGVVPPGGGRQPALLREAHAMRHRAFVEKRGWECLRRPDGLDIDARDADATHILAFDALGLFGYARLLPGGFLVAAVPDPARVEEAVGASKVYGLSRFCIERDERPRERCAAAMVGLLKAVEACARAARIDVLMFDTDPALIFMLRVAGFKIETIGAAVQFYGRAMVPVILRIDEAAFRDISTRWTAWHDVPTAGAGYCRTSRNLQPRAMAGTQQR